MQEAVQPPRLERPAVVRPAAAAAPPRAGHAELELAAGVQVYHLRVAPAASWPLGYRAAARQPQL